MTFVGDLVSVESPSHIHPKNPRRRTAACTMDAGVECFRSVGRRAARSGHLAMGGPAQGGPGGRATHDRGFRHLVALRSRSLLHRWGTDRVAGVSGMRPASSARGPIRLSGARRLRCVDRAGGRPRSPASSCEALPSSRRTLAGHPQRRALSEVLDAGEAPVR